MIGFLSVALFRVRLIKLLFYLTPLTVFRNQLPFFSCVSLREEKKILSMFISRYNAVTIALIVLFTFASSSVRAIAVEDMEKGNRDEI